MQDEFQELLANVEKGYEEGMVGEHFNRPDHDKSHIKVQILDISASRLSWDRKASREEWMKKLMAKEVGRE